MTLQRLSSHLLRGALMACLASSPMVRGQGTPALYDPQPPSDSAYVRVLVGGTTGTSSVQLDSKPVITGLPTGVPSDYLIVPAGKHRMTVLRKAGTPTLDVPLDVSSGRAITVVIPGTPSDTKPLLLEDKTNANRLKATLSVYYLGPQGQPLDILTADGGTKVFSKLMPGAMASLAVNPLTVDLISAATDTKSPLASTHLTLAAGASYSIVLQTETSGQISMKSYVNKVERYTGK